MEFMVTFLQNLMHYFEAGGFVMPFLLLLSMALWAMILERWLYLYGPVKRFGGWSHGKSAWEIRNFEGAVHPYLDRPGPETQESLRAFCAWKQGEMAGFVHRALLEHDVSSPDGLAMSLEEAFSAYAGKVRKRLSLISVLALLAPMLGLLGTVSGMIEAFENMMLAGGADAKALSGGISAALITTQVGLVVALPGLFSRSLFRRRAEKIESDMSLLTMRVRALGVHPRAEGDGGEGSTCSA
jgi:biopolymer transport protein ExbB